MNYTDNYHLGLPLVTEKYDVDVFNTNYTIIDSQMKSTDSLNASHISNKQNPHEVTAAQVGLGNVNNTSDAAKPVSTLQAQAIASAVSAEETRAKAAEQANADAIAAIQGSMPGIATTLVAGLVKPDGTTITISANGTISATQATIDSELSTTSTNAVQNRVVTNALNSKANQSTTYTKTEVDNLLSAFETNIDWKDAVATYSDIATTYPNPQDGWTVNVKDTDYTYRYDGSSWIVISANAVPNATTAVNGLMTSAMVSKLNSIENGAQVNTLTGVKGDAESSYRTGNVNITAANIGLGNVVNVSTNNQTPTFTQASTRANISSGETLSTILGKVSKYFADLSTVAFSGSYSDLSNKPTIGNATLTIQKNGTTVNTFTANATSNVTANITVPTKTSELTNDSGFITSASVGVTGVKGNSESSYRSGNVNITAANIGLGNVGNFKAVSTVASQGLTDTEKSNARANIGAGTSSLTIGTTASTAAAGNHTHTTSIATSTATNQITLAANTKYSITAGGTSYVFTTPPDTNTWRPIGTGATDAAAGNHTHSYLPLSGGTLTGALKVGSPANTSTFPSVGLTVHDTRGIAHTPGAVTEKGVNFFFSNNTMPSSDWWAGMHVHGWSSSYVAWELVGPATTGDKRTVPLYVRTSNGTTAWGSWRKIYDTSNKPSAADVGAATSGHTHTTTIAASSATNQITLAASTKYAITAGGTSYVFTTPPNSTYTVNNGTLTIQKNGSNVATFTANQAGNSTANIITDTWTSTASVSSSGTVSFSGLDDSYGYELYCQNKLLGVSAISKSGSGTSVTLTYTVTGAATGDVCKLRILK